MRGRNGWAMSWMYAQDMFKSTGSRVIELGRVARRR